MRLQLAPIGLLVCSMVPVFANSIKDWNAYSDKVLQVTFRYPKEWKTSPGYSDRTYFGGRDGAVQLSAAEAQTPQEVCRGEATHHLQPFGSHPQIRSMKVQGQTACMVWPSEEQGENADAELVVEFPRPVKIQGSLYQHLTLLADKNHILEITRSLRFISPNGHQK